MSAGSQRRVRQQTRAAHLGGTKRAETMAAGMHLPGRVQSPVPARTDEDWCGIDGEGGCGMTLPEHWPGCPRANEGTVCTCPEHACDAIGMCAHCGKRVWS